jgi:hypothetical protein
MPMVFDRPLVIGETNWLFLILTKLQFINRIFLIRFDFAIAAGVGNAKQAVALLFQLGAESDTIFLGNVTLQHLRRTGGTNPRRTGSWEVKALLIRHGENRTIVGHLNCVGRPAMQDFDGINVRHFD